MSAPVRRLHREIVASLREAAGRGATKDTSRFHKGPHTSLGLSAPQMYRLFATWRDEFAALTLDQRFKLAGLLLASHIEEEGHAAMAVLRSGVDEITPPSFRKLDALLDDFSSWSITDDFATGAAGIKGRLLQKYPDETLRLLDRWSKASNRWKRRVSVVTFTRRVAASGVYLEQALVLCERLQHDPDDLVQKGVGWALKDCIRAGPAARKRILTLVKRMRRDGVPATVTLYALRDVKGREREDALRSVPRC